MGISSSGLISGINADQLVTQLMNLERQPITTLQNRQKDYELKIASFYDINTKLSSFKSALDALNSREKFNTKTASVTQTSSGANLLTVSASSTASAGSYSIAVNQLAAANKKASQGWVDQNTTAIAPSGGTFKFKVGSGGAETTINVTSTMTLQGLRDAINSANGGVTATIINDGTGSNPYRLILTANTTGSSNTIYITSNTTSLDFANKKIEAAYAYTTNGYTGTVASNSGNNYTGTTNKTFLIEAVSTTTYKYSIDGGITWLGSGGAAYNGSNAITANTALTAIDGTGTSNEGVQVSFTASNFTVGDRFSIDVFNPEMQAAQDAVIKIDNTTITKSTNTITDAIQGVTMNLLKADTSSTVTLTVSSDTLSAKDSIKKFVDAYNNVMKFINDQLSYDPEVKKKNPLLGDPTLLEIKNKITSVVSGRIPGLSTTSYTNLSQIGISTDYKTGKLSLDESKLSSALSSDPDAVAKLFIGTATATNTAVTFVSKTSKTQAGTYSISVSTAPEQASLTGDNDLSSNTLLADEKLTFSYSNNKTATSPTYTTFSVTLTAGSTINTIVNNINSTFATQGVNLSASNSSGKLKITSTDYGADIWFQVHGQKWNGSTYVDYSGETRQIWNTTVSTNIKNAAGVNIVGMINGHSATGKGNVLTAASGFAEDGLKISIDSNQTGGFGTISVSSGVSDRLSSSIGSYTNSSSGILKSKTDSIQKTIDRIKEQQARIEDRLADKEKRLREQFARLETLLAKYSTQSQYLTNQLANMPKMGK